MSIPSTPNQMMGRTLLTRAEYHNTSDELVLDNGEAVKITANAHELKIGCVTITWKAWELIQKRVRQIESVR
jgi:hypothetical protein